MSRAGSSRWGSFATPSGGDIGFAVCPSTSRLRGVSNQQTSWETLAALVSAGNAEDLRRFFLQLPGPERVIAASRLSDDARAGLVELLSAEDAADALALLPEVQAADALDDVMPETAAAVLHELPSDEQADLLSELEDEHAERILAAMDPEDARDLRSLGEYDDDEAGGLMTTDHVALPVASTVGEIVSALRARADEIEDLDVQYVYLVDDGRLAGVLRLRDLLLARSQRPATEVMIANPLSVSDDAGIEDLADFFEEYAFLGVPVVDSDGRLLGVVYRGGLDEALRDRAARDLRRSQGVLQEELRSMTVPLRAGRRLSWLSLNVVLNVIAASVIAFFEETLSQVIALAVFLPIISDMSGCSGNQAVAVSMRELSLGLVRPNEVLRVWRQEISVGIINGLALGALVAIGGWLWQGNAWFGLVVGAALAINTVLAVSLGGCVPLLLKRLDVDPAIASGPILTTVTDMCGFFLVLGLATLLLEFLI